MALAAAALFGAATPALKPVAGALNSFLLAGLLYLGAFVGLVLARAARGGAAGEARLGRADLLPLGGAILCGGVAAPVLLVWGLSGIPASAASVLLSTEAVLTLLVAALLFREPVAGRVWLAALLVLGAGALWEALPPAARILEVVHAR
jgi:drug/metabolite transporter (DMT)-like permease